jgi:hypothetical protein
MEKDNKKVYEKPELTERKNLNEVTKGEDPFPVSSPTRIG